MEIRCDTSPKHRCWYRIMDDFDRLSIHKIIAVFSHDWVVGVPFLEIDVNVAVKYFVRCVWVDCLSVVEIWILI